MVGTLNPLDNTNSTASRPAHSNTAAGERRWYTDDGIGTRVHAQDLNAVLAQFRAAADFYSITDTEGADDYLKRTLEAVAASVAVDPAFVTDTTAALAVRLRVDAAQGLNVTQQGQGRTNLGLGALAVLAAVGTAQITDANVTNAKLANMAQATIKGRAAGAGTGVATDLTPAQAKTILAIDAADITGLGALATLGAVATANINNNAVTLGKMATLAEARVIGRATGAGTGDPTALTGAQVKAMLAIASGDVSGLGSLATASTISGADWAVGGTDLAVADGGTGASTAAAARTNLGLVLGTDVQAYSAKLAAIAGLTAAADRLSYWTGVSTAAITTLTAFGRSLIDDADAAAGRATLGLGGMALQDPGAVAITGGTITGVSFDSSLNAAVANATPTFQLTETDTSAVARLYVSASITYLEADTTAGDLRFAGFGATNLSSLKARFGAAWKDVLYDSYAGSPTLGGLNLTAALAVASGGTGSGTASGARTNLGLGSLATASTINGGNWSGTDLALADGGTGSSTAAGARTNLGLGTAATQNTGTSGTAIPLLDGVNTWAGAQTMPAARLSSATAVALNSTGHAFQVGTDDALVNLAMSRTAIQARSNGAGSSLFLNPLGGDVTLGDARSTVTVVGGIALGTALALTEGGTGAVNASGARTNLGLGTLAVANSINNGNWSGTALAVANGGTGATSASAARTALGLAAIAASGAAADLSGTVAIANGGTGATTAGAARTALGLAAIAASGAASDLTGTVAVANGGTGSTTAGAARTALGLAALATLATVGTAQIDDSAVTLAKMANIATATFLGRTTAATGVVEALSVAQAKALLAIGVADITGLSAAATTAIGTAGAVIPLLNAANTWSATQIFSGIRAKVQGGFFSLGVAVAATIASDAITATASTMVIDTEAAAATDNLATINGGNEGDILVLRTANGARDVTVKHGTGNIFLNAQVDFTLTGTRDRLMLMYTGQLEWVEIGRGDNAP